MRIMILVALLVAVAGCANSLNQATSDRYQRQCASAERAGDLRTAEQACYRSLANVDWGRLGPSLKSERLYNLARIKRQLSKFSEARDLLMESLETQRKLPNASPTKIGRRLAEISINYAGLKQWDVGSLYVKELIPISQKFSGSERRIAKLIFEEYAKHLSENRELATTLLETASRLGS